MEQVNMQTPYTARIRYIADLPKYQTEKPYIIDEECLEDDAGIERTNVIYDVQPTNLLDLRRNQAVLPFDKHCFKYISYTPNKALEMSLTGVRQACKDMISLLQDHVKAEKYLCYDMRTRKAGTIQPITHGTVPDPSFPNPPFTAAHTDHTREGGWDRVARHLTRAEKTKYLDGSWRIRIWNLWRPLIGPVEDVPLAICDPCTIHDNDLLECDQVGPENTGPPGSTYLICRNKAQTWYWLPHQTEYELLLFLSWDSHPPYGNFNWCPHTAFIDQLAPSNAKPRQSIEFRIMTFNALNGTEDSIRNCGS